MVSLANGQNNEGELGETLDVQSDLINNYKEALKNGDRSAARSCLLAAKLFSANDLNVINEIYLMAKHDNDILEASKCFSTIFNQLVSDRGQKFDVTASSVRDYLHDEIYFLIDDLKSYYFKLKLKNQPTQVIMDAYTKQSGLKRPSVISFVGHKPPESHRPFKAPAGGSLSNGSEVRKFFYRQLFDNLSPRTKMDLLEFSINSCDNLVEKCLLIVVAISVFQENVANYGKQLLDILCDLSGLDDPASSERNSASEHDVIVQDYTRRLLVEDAIPLVFSFDGLDWANFEMEQLLRHVFAYYDRVCLRQVSGEHKFDDLHDGLKRTIAARILGKESSSIGDNVEEGALCVLNQIFLRYIEIFRGNSEIYNQLSLFRKTLLNSTTTAHDVTNELLKIMLEVKLHDVPMKFVENPTKEICEDDQIRTATPPTKGRGRPKKAQSASQPSNQDPEVRRLNQLKARQAYFIVYSLVQQICVNSLKYLKLTRSRVVLTFANPLASLVESEIGKASSQRTSRSKHLGGESGASPAKKSKIEISPAKPLGLTKKNSPLNSAQSQKLDFEIVKTVMGAWVCIYYFELEGDFVPEAIKFVWRKFHASISEGGSRPPHWYTRVEADGLMAMQRHDDAVEKLEKIIELGETTSETNNEDCVKQLRALVQLISCRVQLEDKGETYKSIDRLLAKIRGAKGGFIDESYASGNMIDEYMVPIDGKDEEGMENLGFLFFDPLSMIRYAIEVVMDILRRHVVCLNASSDTVIGHIITLSQFDWPKESALYEQCTSWLRANKPKSTTPQCLSAATKFSYDSFFAYIFNPNIIEDFMAMLNRGYTLDIKTQQVVSVGSASQQRSTSASGAASATTIGVVATRGSSAAASAGGSTSTRSGKAITTRGVNKTFKEDLRLALVAQMKQSTTLIPLELISEFVQTILIPFLSSARK